MFSIVTRDQRSNWRSKICLIRVIRVLLL